MITETKLTVLIRSVVHAIVEAGNTTNTRSLIQPLLDAGIVSGMNVELDDDSYANRRITLEWYAGQIVEIVENSQWFAMNSIINCLDKFVPAVDIAAERIDKIDTLITEDNG